MSNLDNEKDYSNLTDALQFVFNQLLKNIWISIPGIIESYNQTTKRCRVRPAINIRKTDGTTEPQSAIVNVPVVWPSGGGFTILSPLPEGTPVEIKFSQRGITAFKQTFAQEDPGGRILDKEDAYVYPSFGSLTVSPATASGMSMQTEDGTNYIYVEDGNIKINATSKVTVTSPTVEVNATNTNINSIDTTITGTLLTVNADIDLNGNIDMTGDITGPTVFGGASGSAHGHTQGVDSANDTQQKTNGPS